MTRLMAMLLAGFLTMVVLAPIGRVLPSWLPLPSIPVLVTLYLALGVRGSHSAGAACAAALGYVTDLLAGAPKGTYILALLIVYFTVRGLSSRLYVQGRLSQIGVSFAASLFAAALAVSIHVALPPRGAWSALRLAPAEAAMTAALAAPYFYLLWRLDRRVAREAATEGVFR
jgi:rod shape-determining protein MreD